MGGAFSSDGDPSPDSKQDPAIQLDRLELTVPTIAFSLHI